MTNTEIGRPSDTSQITKNNNTIPVHTNTMEKRENSYSQSEKLLLVYLKLLRLTLQT